MQSISLVRYKKDLRIADHAPLRQACQGDLPVVGLYVREPSMMQFSDYSHFHQYRIQESLKDLKSSLKQLNIPLIMIHAEMEQAFDMIWQYYSIHSMCAHEETGNGLTYARDLSVISYCTQSSIEFIEYPSNGVIRRLASRDLRSNMQRQRMSQPLIAVPAAQDPFDLDLELITTTKASFEWFIPATKPPTWIHPQDVPGEQAAYYRLQYFLTHAGPYRYALSRPKESVMDSSRLSWYLTYGNLSIRQVHQATFVQIHHLKSLPKTTSTTKQLASLRAFYQRLFWRCHFVQKLESQPSIEYYNQNREFDQIRSEVRHDYIQAWYDWTTGIPLIDAGMRCLQATGWINFRMRATLVSFICNTCMQPRQEIGPMLARVFLDYEPGIHYSQLQMQSGTTGINTIRIYNPLKQLVDKDEDLTFVRRWLPELVSLTSDEIKILGTSVGNALIQAKDISYPLPIVDVVLANREARAALRSVKSQPATKQAAKKVFDKLGSRKSSTRRKPKTQSAPLDTPSLFD
jgi:deoxyribodipyrimidine photo-lyase